MGEVAILDKQNSSGNQKVSLDVSMATICAAALANLAIAVAKFVAAYFTGSSAMLSEGIHSVVDTGNEVLLYIGIERSKKPADRIHPFGYGPEIYFWTLLVGVLIFAIGGGVSVFEGVSHILHPNEIENPFWTFAVLGSSFVFESISLSVGLREMKARKRGKKKRSLFGRLKASKDPSVFAVVIEDIAALIGLAIAIVGVSLSLLLRDPRYDGAASILIGLMLMIVAVVLMQETRDLMIGESADEEIVCAVREIVESDGSVQSLSRILTMHLAPYEVLLTLDMKFSDSLTISEVRQAIVRIEKAIKTRFQLIQHIYIESSAIGHS